MSNNDPRVQPAHITGLTALGGNTQAQFVSCVCCWAVLESHRVDMHYAFSHAGYYDGFFDELDEWIKAVEAQKEDE